MHAAAGSDADSLPASFTRAARRYDLMVALNPGYHRHLADAAAELVRRSGGGRVIDAGCGSGASIRALLAAGATRILGVDASAGMLERARAKVRPDPAGRREVVLRLGRAEHLPSLADGEPVDGVLAAYLFRNIPEPDRAATLVGIRAVLRPGGWLVVQDYSVGRRTAADAIWTIVCWLVVIPLSRLLLNDTGLYRYLWRSARRNDTPQHFMDRMAEAGFSDIATRTVDGWQRHILHTYVARAS